MAEFNQLGPSGARFASTIARITGMQEQLGVNTLSPEIGCIINLEQNREYDCFLRKIRYGQATSVAAAAPNFSFIQWALPTTPVGIIAVVESLRTWSATAVTTRIDSAIIGGGTRAVPIDTRFWTAFNVSGRQSQLLAITGNTAGASGTTVDSERPLAATGPHVEHNNVRGLILTPGHNLTVWGEAINNFVSATLGWYERVAAPDELEP